MNSSRKLASKILGVIDPNEAERFLQDVANVDLLDHRLAGRIIDRNPGVFRWTMGSGNNKFETLLIMQSYLRKAWDAPDARSRQWWLFKLRDIHQRVAKMGVYHDSYLMQYRPPIIGEFLLGPEERVPDITPLEAALFYFQERIDERAKHCSGPTCPAPYFIASKKRQKFCSPKCAEPSQRDSKRQWWRDNRAKDRGLLQ